MHEYQHQVLKTRSTGRVAMCLQEEQRIWPGGEMETVKIDPPLLEVVHPDVV